MAIKMVVVRVASMAEKKVLMMMIARLDNSTDSKRDDLMAALTAEMTGNCLVEMSEDELEAQTVH